MKRRPVWSVVCCMAFFWYGSVAAGEVELVWTMGDGKTVVERRPLPEREDVAVFTLPQSEIVAKGAKSLEITPDFACAKKGEKGFWAFSDGEYGTFRCDNGVKECNRWQMMSLFGMQTQERTFVAIVRKLKYYFTTRIAAKNGVYRMSCVLTGDLVSSPYEDFEIAFHRLTGPEATLGGMARCYRNWQIARGACQPLKERIKSNQILRQAIEGVEIRVRQAWKPAPSPIPDQTPENEPPVMSHVTFDRVTDIARELKRQGISTAEFCLVGWNVGGHDGRWPQMFPVEPSLGGEKALRKCIADVIGLGYLIVPHGNFLDAYRIADSWDEEWLVKDVKGEVSGTSGVWGGGKSYHICPKRAYERFVSRDLLRLKALGFKGLGYFDVVSVVQAKSCADPRHPLDRRQAADWWGKSAALSKACLGGFSSEGAFDHFVGNLDFGLYVSFEDPRQEMRGLVDRIEPMPQLVYNGIFATNPFTRTVNVMAQDRYWQLKLVEFSGRPVFYFYSKFMNKGWMGANDLACETDDQLRASVAKIKQGVDVYARLVDLQYEYILEHDRLNEHVARTTYANGTRVYVNYADREACADGVCIPALDFLVVK